MVSEKLVYWFFRLNGCFTIENFIVHPDGRDGQRTDADLLAVRFAHRQELLTSGTPMQDAPLFTSVPRTQLFFVEVKTGECELNGPWTDPKKQNLQRVLNAVGMVPVGSTAEVAKSLYNKCSFVDDHLSIRIVAVGTTRNGQLGKQRSAVQITFDELLKFIHDRMTLFHQQKADHQQWDETGRELYDSAVNAYRDDVSKFQDHWRRRIINM